MKRDQNTRWNARYRGEYSVPALPRPERESHKADRVPTPPAERHVFRDEGRRWRRIVAVSAILSAILTITGVVLVRTIASSKLAGPSTD